MSPISPFEVFQEWYQEVLATPSITEPAAMVLATADQRGHPSARVVLLREFDERGLVFYTNYQSRKGSELLANPQASLCFYWMELHKQVRVEGTVLQVSSEEADAYFAKRPRGSQIGAWASLQSSPLSETEILKQRIQEYTEKFSGKDILRPPHWSGFRIVPHYWEFWQEGQFRLHSRTIYCKNDAGWEQSFLYP